jgi:hypothetical protein
MPRDKRPIRPPRPLKDQIVTFKCTETERAIMEQRAVADGLTLSAWIRQTCYRKAGILS